MRRIIFLVVVGFAIALLAPLADSRSLTNLIVAILFAASVASAWNIIGGLAGQFSLCNALFLLTGAFTSGFLFVHGVSPWIGMIAGATLAALLAALLGLLTFPFRLKGLFFALVTLVFSQAGVFVIEGLPGLGGQSGLRIPYEEGLWNLQFQSEMPYMIWLVVVLGTIMTVTHQVSVSRLGYELRAVRENEDAAAAVGIDAAKVKTIAFMISAAATAPLGTFYAQYYGYIEARTLGGSLASVQLLLPAIVGGTLFLFGPLLGSALLATISAVSREYFGSVAGLEGVIYGAVTIILMWVLPAGLCSGIDRFRKKCGGGRRDTQSPRTRARVADDA